MALKNSAREARSTTGVPVMPMELFHDGGVHARSGWGTGAPKLRCQTMVPFTVSSAYTLFDSVTAMTMGPLGPPSM
jgi:hypothetical protein